MRFLVYLRWFFFELKKNEAGAVAAEYAYLIAFIAIVATLGMVLIGPSIADYFDAVTRLVPDNSATPSCPFGCS